MRKNAIALLLAALLLLPFGALAGCEDNCAIHTLITEENLTRALACETALAEACAARAERAEGDEARLYAALADAALLHQKMLRKAGATASDAAEGDALSADQYALFAVQAVNDVRYPAAKTFVKLAAAKATHALALQALALAPDAPMGEIRLCPGCGRVEIGEAGEYCPVCFAAGDTYAAY